MKKIEFLKKLFETEDVKSTDCGQKYWVKIMAKTKQVWVDNLPGGRVSIKVKGYSNKLVAMAVAEAMYHSLVNMPGSVVDAATKWSVYRIGDIAFGPKTGGWAARLICDKHW